MNAYRDSAGRHSRIGSAERPFPYLASILSVDSSMLSTISGRRRPRVSDTSLSLHMASKECGAARWCCAPRGQGGVGRGLLVVLGLLCLLSGAMGFVPSVVPTPHSFGTCTPQGLRREAVLAYPRRVGGWEWALEARSASASAATGEHKHCPHHMKLHTNI